MDAGGRRSDILQRYGMDGHLYVESELALKKTVLGPGFWKENGFYDETVEVWERNYMENEPGRFDIQHLYIWFKTEEEAEGVCQKVSAVLSADTQKIYVSRGGNVWAWEGKAYVPAWSATDRGEKTEGEGEWEEEWVWERVKIGQSEYYWCV